MGRLTTLEEAISIISDGSTLGIGGFILRRKPMSLIRAIIGRGVTNLTIHSFLASLDVELLLGAGVGRKLHTAYVGFEALGLAPNFGRLAKAGLIEIHEHSEYTLVSALRATQMGLPFLPTRGAMGSQLLDELGYQLINCPYSGEPLVAVPAFSPDVTILHACLADEQGNVYMPEVPDFLLEYDYVLARAARKVIVSTERIVKPQEALALAPRIALFSYEVDLVVEAPGGALPAGQPPLYEVDWGSIMQYLQMASTSEGFQTYLERFLALDSPRPSNARKCEEGGNINGIQ